jgi:hypothetical protein
MRVLRQGWKCYGTLHFTRYDRGRSIPTHYQILGLSRDASSVDIAHAFREKLANARTQPDADERSEAIRFAYQVLANPTLRAQYDAELPPDVRQLRERARREREPNRLVEIFGEMSGPKRIALLAGFLIVAFMIYEVWPPRVPAAPAPAVAPVAKKAAEPLEDQAVATVNLPREKHPAAARPMTPEEIFAAVSPSIVKIVAPDGSGGGAQGSGVVTGGGVVITNCHVVAHAPEILVKQGDQTYPAEVRIADRELDLCSLSVAGLMAPPVTMSTFDAKVGQRVYAIGAPQGLELTLSEGLISALRETNNGAIIQTSAAVSRGSSGGGLFNTSAQLVGIVTFQAKSGQNLNFALPAAWISEMTSRDSSTGLSPAR